MQANIGDRVHVPQGFGIVVDIKKKNTKLSREYGHIVVQLDGRSVTQRYSNIDILRIFKE